MAQISLLSPKPCERLMGLNQHRLKLRIALLPQIDEAGVVIDGLLSFPSSLVYLRQT